MEEVKKRKTRMYDPWGYQEENNYQSTENIIENDLDSFFANATYNKEDKKIHFTNKDGEEVETLDVTEFTPSGGTSYTFNNGLQENEGTVSVLIDSESEPYLTTSDDGVKISGIDYAISDAVTVEKNRAEASEEALQTAITTEEERAKSKEDELDEKIDAEVSARTESDSQLLDTINDEITRATEKEEELDEKIDSVSSGLSEAVETLAEKLGYKNNDTLQTNNEHEVAFGEYNISHESEEASGQTIFSIGNGTSDDNRSNAVEVMKNGDVYLLIEGEMMNINLLLGQIAHEVYD